MYIINVLHNGCCVWNNRRRWNMPDLPIVSCCVLFVKPLLHASPSDQTMVWLWDGNQQYTLSFSEGLSVEKRRAMRRPLRSIDHICIITAVRRRWARLIVVIAMVSLLPRGRGLIRLACRHWQEQRRAWAWADVPEQGVSSPEWPRSSSVSYVESTERLITDVEFIAKHERPSSLMHWTRTNFLQTFGNSLYSSWLSRRFFLPCY